jgi:hypothetical protein
VRPIERGLSETLTHRNPAVHAGSSHIGTRSLVRTTPEIKGATVPAAATGRTSSRNKRCPIDESIKPRLVSACFTGS